MKKAEEVMDEFMRVWKNMMKLKKHLVKKRKL